MPLIRTRADIDDILGGPTPAEEELLARCLAGEPCHLGDEVPLKGTPDPQVHIRADVLRYLITGGCEEHPTADWGVDVYGAHVTGLLDLSLATARGVTGLILCRFEAPILARQANLQLLILNHSVFPRLNAQGAQVTGDVFLRDTTAEDTVDIGGGIIGGQLACDNSEFKATSGHALNFQGTQINSDVFLRDIVAKSTVHLAGSTIGGYLDSTGASLKPASGDALNAHSARVRGSIVFRNIEATATVNISGATIDGQLSCMGAGFNASSGTALGAQGAQIADGFFFRDVTTDGGLVDLNSAHADTLVDDPGSWPSKDKLILDGFTYTRIENTAFPRVKDRLDWLAKGSTWGHEFLPQPYVQLAKVYREIGHDKDAQSVLFDLERQRRRHHREQSRIAPTGDIDVALKGLWRDMTNLWRLAIDLLLRLIVGYGIRPFRSLWILGGMTLLATWLAHMAWEEGSMAPNSAVILTSDDWSALENTVPSPAETWSARDGPGRDWATFNRYAYGADLVIPIIDLGQTDAWAPSTNREVWGQRLWRYGFFLSIAGWIVTALGAAAITGIIRRE